MSIHKQKLWNDMCATVKSSDGYKKLLEDINKCAKDGNTNFTCSLVRFSDDYCSGRKHAAMVEVIRSLGLTVSFEAVSIIIDWSMHNGVQA